MDDDKKEITFRYKSWVEKDTREKSFQDQTMDVYEFMTRMLFFLPDPNRKMIRYYGIYANRIKEKLAFIEQRTWAQAIENSFEAKPQNCPDCFKKMQLIVVYSYSARKTMEGLKETNVFLDSSETRLLNGEQVYLVNLGNKIKLKKKESQNASEDIPYSAYILAKDGMYFTEQKFSDYTVANTKFKGDLNAITFVRNEFEKRGIYLNYINFSLTKIAGGEFPKEAFFMASAHVNYPSSDLSDKFSTRNIILKQNDGVYKVVSGSIYTSTPIRFKDLDKDGEMEIIVKAPTRGGEETLIYGLLDGKYQSLNYLLYNMNFYEIELKGDKVKAKKWLTSEGTNTETPKIQIFKYQKGSFVEIR